MHRLRAVLVAVCAAAAVLGAVPGAKAAPQPVRVAVLDSGITATHQEFAPGQVVLWHDFVNGQNATPYDDNGHGTLVASTLAGLNAAPAKNPKSLAPGVELVVGKVLNSAGSETGHLGEAVRWAVDVGHVDIINISIYYYLPLTGGSDSAFEAFDYARSKGVLITVCNGNGLLNAELPGALGWATSFDTSPSVLSVGASDTVDALLTHTDPEVVASYTATGAAANTSNKYVTESGTSFASPYVAGFAARLIEAARANGKTLKADRLEQLIKYSALNTYFPPTFEGYGIIDATRLNAAIGYARRGTLPTRPSPDLNKLYVDTLLPQLRTVGRMLSVI
jgi:subtilisin family serine protease